MLRTEHTNLTPCASIPASAALQSLLFTVIVMNVQTVRSPTFWKPTYSSQSANCLLPILSLPTATVGIPFRSMFGTELLTPSDNSIDFSASKLAILTPVSFPLTLVCSQFLTILLPPTSLVFFRRHVLERHRPSIFFSPVPSTQTLRLVTACWTRARPLFKPLDGRSTMWLYRQPS